MRKKRPLPRKVLRKSFSFTLLEVLIGFFILSLTLTGLSIQGAKLIQQERFERAIDMISERIEYAYELLLFYQNDFTMICEKKGKIIEISFVIKGKNPAYAKKIAPVQTIKGIERILLNGEEVSNLHLVFSQNCSEEQKVTFLSSHKKRIFTLKGVS